MKQFKIYITTNPELSSHGYVRTITVFGRKEAESQLWDLVSLHPYQIGQIDEVKSTWSHDGAEDDNAIDTSEKDMDAMHNVIKRGDTRSDPYEDYSA